MLVPVILSGGAGTRLWPVSRKALPKPFMRLADGETLAAKTLQRAMAVADPDAQILTLTSRDYYFLTRDAYLDVLPDARRFAFVLEPCARNTAPAIGAAALWVREKYGPEAQLLVLPADHLIRDLPAFTDAVARAKVRAAAGELVTFGIHPTRPETGFGYIRAGAARPGEDVSEVAEFVEKPDLTTAQAYLQSGDYAWNSGMFLFRADALLEAMAEHAAAVHHGLEQLWAQVDSGQQPLELPQPAFAAIPDISIDYAVMEKASRRSVVRCSLGWSDIGSWRAISELYESDTSGNRIRGKAILVDSRDCYVQSEDRLVAAVGVDDLVIVDTGDAVLVANNERVQEVRQVVKQLTHEDHDAATYHRTVHRPWGSYTVLEDAEDCKVKRLVVKPGQILSLQRHQRRSEHWTVIRGVARVRVGDDEQDLQPNQSAWIPVNTLHRLHNPGSEDLHLIEVQTGDYFGEDDIERFEDVYGRPTA
ncbi:MAG: mannose-1-phosphate guanylyltransferase/mannose-6-phosphate isomerase [Wenzhouxiangellaceae bacterium]